MRSIQMGAIRHVPMMEMRHTLADGRICIRVETAAGDFERVTLRAAAFYAPGDPFSRDTAYDMERLFRDELHDTWQAVFRPDDPRVIYCFVLERGRTRVLLDASGARKIAKGCGGIDGFHFAHAYPAVPKPQWARGTVGYQIFPDRFRRAGAHPGEAAEPWDSPRIQNEYRFGGNLAGMIEAVPYLRDLGVKIVYLTPIFLSDTSHRYNTYDYYTIDPMLGTKEELCRLSDRLHEAGMRLVLDGVFNHSGVKFPPFMDAMEKGKASEYYDWFWFDKRFRCGYMTFAHELAYMPKLNMRNEQCAAYFLDVGRYWLREAKIDGWRLDVSPEVYPDFWRRFRRAVLEENPEAITIAECWHDSREWCTDGDMFDGTMNYVLSQAIWRRFAEESIPLAAFDGAVNRAMALYPGEVQASMWNFISSHDTMRMLTRAKGNRTAMRAAVFFQMTMPGVPVIYYGDELGMEGGNDPYCRGAMTWDKVGGNEMLSYYQQLTALRGESVTLREGDFKTHEVGADGLYAYLRRTDGETLLCLLNTGKETISRGVMLPEELTGGHALVEMKSKAQIPVSQDRVTVRLEPGEGWVLGCAAQGCDDGV